MSGNGSKGMGLGAWSAGQGASAPVDHWRTEKGERRAGLRLSSATGERRAEKEERRLEAGTSTSLSHRIDDNPVRVDQ